MQFLLESNYYARVLMHIQKKQILASTKKNFFWVYLLLIAVRGFTDGITFCYSFNSYISTIACYAQHNAQSKVKKTNFHCHSTRLGGHYWF